MDNLVVFTMVVFLKAQIMASNSGEWTFSQRMAIQQVTFTLNPMVRMSSLNTLMMTERLAASLMHQLKPNRSRFND